MIRSLPLFYSYTGREYNYESGLYFYRARYYDSKVERFLEPDPISFFGGMNFYAYVGNNPVNFVDPWGWCKKKWWDPVLHPSEFYNRAKQIRTQGHETFPGTEPLIDFTRHFHASNILANEYGPGWTRLAGIINEIQGFIWHDIRNLPSRLRGETPWAFQWSDILANEAGIKATGQPCLRIK